MQVFSSAACTRGISPCRRRASACSRTACSMLPPRLQGRRARPATTAARPRSRLHDALALRTCSLVAPRGAPPRGLAAIAPAVLHPDRRHRRASSLRAACRAPKWVGGGGSEGRKAGSTHGTAGSRPSPLRRAAWPWPPCTILARRTRPTPADFTRHRCPRASGDPLWQQRGGHERREVLVMAARAAPVSPAGGAMRANFSFSQQTSCSEFGDVSESDTNTPKSAAFNHSTKLTISTGQSAFTQPPPPSRHEGAKDH